MGQVKLVLNSNAAAKLTIVEKAVWHGYEGGYWTQDGDTHILSIGYEGSGLFRFREPNGQIFSVVVGLGYSSNPWGDVQVNLANTDTSTKLLPEYYGGRLNSESHNQIERTSASGATVNLSVSTNGFQAAYATLEYS